MSEILTSFGVDWHLLVVSIVNFSVLAVILWYIMIKPILALLEQRESTIRTSLERAELERQEAKLLETKLADDRQVAAQRAQKIVAEAEAKATAIVKHAATAAEVKATTILADANKKAASERDRLFDDATRQLADVVVDATTLIVGKTVTATVDQTLVSSAIADAKKSA